MIRKAPSPVPFEGGLECRPEDRAAPALVIEPTGRRFAPPWALHYREWIVAAMRGLAHQELGVLSPGLQLRCGALKLAVNALASNKRRRRVALFCHPKAARAAAVAAVRRRVMPPEHVREYRA